MTAKNNTDITLIHSSLVSNFLGPVYGESWGTGPHMESDSHGI